VEYHASSANFVSAFFTLAEKSNHIVITGHESADDDSLSSVLSIFHLLISRYPEKNIRMCYTGEAENRFAIFQNYSQIEFSEDMANILGKTDLLIMLDGGDFGRFSHHPEILKKIPHTICIDHHASQPDSFSLSLIIPTSPACSQIVYQTFFANQKIDKNLAEIFLWGILGDTGNLVYLKPFQIDTLAIIQKLLEISQIEIQEFLAGYQSISQKILSVVLEFIKNTRFITIAGWPPLQYSFIDQDYMKSNQLSDNQISEAGHLYGSEYVRTITGYTWGFVLTPRSDGNVNISCRSLPKSVNVRILMEKMKIGGGHDRASGGTFVRGNEPLDIAPCLEQTFTWLKNNTPVLG
jgi:nanoRNase/pAp phosphatase (c-di-AMP/oligoRNAs hydrolase)